jgi:hypothetical protein
MYLLNIYPPCFHSVSETSTDLHLQSYLNRESLRKFLFDNERSGFINHGFLNFFSYLEPLVRILKIQIPLGYIT